MSLYKKEKKSVKHKGRQQGGRDQKKPQNRKLNKWQ